MFAIQNLTSRKGKITGWDLGTCKGIVKMRSGKVHRFHGADFSSGRPTRWPKVGDKVSVIFVDQAVLCVELERS
jgi:hypothetical protein